MMQVRQAYQPCPQGSRNTHTYACKCTSRNSKAEARNISARSGKTASAHVDVTEDNLVAYASPSPATRRQTLMTFCGSALGALAAAATGTLAPAPAIAALKDYNLDPNAPIEEVNVQLGNEDGDYVFVPNTLEFTMGRIYKLKLRNPSTTTHYFTPLEFASKIFTIQVLVGDPAVEVKGGITEVALKAGGSATWIFIPMKPGRYPVKCTIKGHDAMVGQLVVKRPE